MIVINAPNFYVTLSVENNRVAVASPALAWMKGKRVSEVLTYCRRRGWGVTVM